MTTTTFDTLMQAKKLQDKGFTPEQAEATVEMLKEVIDTQLATKQDLREMEYRIISRIGGMIAIAVGMLVAIIKL